MNEPKKKVNRKISLPEFCCPHSFWTSGGDTDCDHDYPPETEEAHTEHHTWTCSKCGMRTSFEVYQ